MVSLFGLAFGSFLNVCIWRLPRGESIISPRSRCPRCATPIPWYDNIPIVSYLLLRARCRNCHISISPLSPAVELLTASVFVISYRQFDLSPEFVKHVVLGMLLIILVFTDLLVRRIPHPVTLLGMALGLFLGILIPVDPRPAEWLLVRLGVFVSPLGLSLLGSVTGSLIGGGLLYVVAEVFYRLTGKEGLGFGDVMMMLMVGTFLGVPLTLMTILLGSLLGTIVAVPFELFTSRLRHHAWPFGSFLGIAGIFSSFWGPNLLALYLRWAGFTN
jgi:leader peptidase (prepilin peptidase)/N-methyltransferase